MKGYKREEERRAPFPSKYLRRGSSGTRLRKRQLYIYIYRERESCSSIQSTALLYTCTQSAASSVPHPTGLLPRGLPTSQKSFSLPPYPPHHLPSKTKPPRALLPLGASEAYRCATRAPEHTAPENGDTFLIEKNGRIEETAGVRGDSHGQAARRTSLFPHSSRTD